MDNVDVIKKQITYNYSNRFSAIEYIVIHDTGNPGVGANAEAHFNYFNGGNRGSSADIFVDSNSIWIVNDYKSKYTWHCGDGKGKFGITNANSVGVEMCINMDGDRDKTEANTIEIVKSLMSELDIPIDRVVRHYDASRKNCPASMSKNNWSKWHAFKDKLIQREEVNNVPKTVYSLDDVHVQVIDPWNFSIKRVNKNKKDITEQNYANAGFFGKSSDGSTIPVGNLVIDGKVITEAGNQPDWLNTFKKKQTTLIVHNNDNIEFVEKDIISSIPDVKYAISGIPIIRNGYKVSMEDIKAEGYFGNECYGTWHGFIGIRDNRLVYVAAKLDFELMVYLLEVLGIKDAIKLDGGGSFVLHNGDFEVATEENRRIDNIVAWKG